MFGSRDRQCAVRMLRGNSRLCGRSVGPTFCLGTPVLSPLPATSLGKLIDFPLSQFIHLRHEIIIVSFHKDAVRMNSLEQCLACSTARILALI